MKYILECLVSTFIQHNVTATENNIVQLKCSEDSSVLTIDNAIYSTSYRSNCIFCPNPGPLINGRIYVVLKDERISPLPIRSEFRSYIPNVSHGRTIEFECNSGYVLQGSTGLTCNHGRWMPAERPRCIIEHHVQPNIIFTG
ncbi:unnamed protein product [Rotaria sp. Silwood1]|nr:unnamed protein product [Rotaria sp. Silwood1]